MRRIVGRDTHRYAIPDDHADIKSLHFSAKFRGDLNAVVQGDNVLSPSGRIGDFSFKSGKVFFGQSWLLTAFTSYSGVRRRLLDHLDHHHNRRRHHRLPEVQEDGPRRLSRRDLQNPGR